MMDESLSSPFVACSLRPAMITRQDARRLRGNILAIDFSSDGKFLATGGIDQSAPLWEVTTGKELFHLGEHAGFVYAVKFSPDGTMLATGSDCVRLWSTGSGKEVVTMAELPHWVESVAFSPDGKLVASARKIFPW